MRITKPSAANYPPHKCEWGFRNPRNHLKPIKFAQLLEAMIARGDQRIICPGCGRDAYLELKICGHNHKRPLTPAQQKKRERMREEFRRKYSSVEGDF